MVLFFAMLFYPIQLLLTKVKQSEMIKGYQQWFRHYKFLILSGLAMGVILAGGSFAFIYALGLQPEGLSAANETSGLKQNIEANSAVETIAKPEPLSGKLKLEVPRFTEVLAYEITVNNRVVALFRTESEAQLLLESLKEKYTCVDPKAILKVYFGENVEISKNYIDIVGFDGYDTLDEAMAYIANGFKENRTHVVKKGENYWIIANYYGISPSDLESANPEIKPELLQIGQNINLTVPKPLITVYTVERSDYSIEIPFEVVYEPSADLFKEEMKTKTSGQLGEKAVTAEIFKKNGLEIEREITEESILSEPVNKVVYQGTKTPPPKMGSGILSKPTSRGSVSSEFGWRWGRRHEGIDIGVPENTEVKAADGGTVIYAAYSSSYGNYIIIDHGGNISTLYAHNNKLLVKKGDKVYKGQQISLSGNTGRSQAPHLHFEVRKNGVPQNPREYVTFN